MHPRVAKMKAIYIIIISVTVVCPDAFTFQKICKLDCIFHERFSFMYSRRDERCSKITPPPLFLGGGHRESVVTQALVFLRDTNDTHNKLRIPLHLQNLRRVLLDHE